MVAQQSAQAAQRNNAAGGGGNGISDPGWLSYWWQSYKTYVNPTYNNGDWMDYGKQVGWGMVGVGAGGLAGVGAGAVVGAAGAALGSGAAATTLAGGLAGGLVGGEVGGAIGGIGGNVGQTIGSIGGGLLGGMGGANLATPAPATVARVAAGEGEVLPATIVRPISRGERVADLVREAAERTYASGGLEHAIVSLNDGTRAIVQGGSGGIQFGEDVARVILHTHPFTTGPSAADFAMLAQMEQRSSWIYELFGGGLTKFSRNM